jgi:hypothetical protein
MTAAMRITDRILKCAVFLGTLSEEGIFDPVSTGFLVCSGTEGEAFQHIITTSHSVEPYSELYVKVNRHDGTAYVIPQPITKWYFHPQSTERFIDLAVCPVAMPRDVYDTANVFLSTDILTKEKSSRWDIGVGDELFYPGLFTSHAGAAKNIPLMRTGTIAAMPDEMVMTNRRRTWLYLIESRSIGGHSGSPVFVNLMVPRNYYSEKQVPLPFPGEHSGYLLLGMLRSHFTLEDTGEQVIAEGTGAASRLVRANSGIATVVPAWEIEETINQQELADERESVLASLRAKIGDTPD